MGDARKVHTYASNARELTMAWRHAESIPEKRPMDSNKVSQGGLLTQDGSSSVGTMHERPDDGGHDKEFDLQKGRKKLKALQHKVSP